MRDVDDRPLADLCLSGCFSKLQYVVACLGLADWKAAPALQLLISFGLVPGPETQQGLECSHRLLAPIMAKRRSRSGISRWLKYW